MTARPAFGVPLRPGERAGRVRIELDLPHEVLRPSPLPVLRQIEAFLREQEVEESGSVLARSAELLETLGGAGYRRVDHWESDPGGWLPLPEASHRGTVEPVAHLVRALKSPSWRVLAGARAFSVRLSRDDGRRADAVVLRWHREREHSITVDLWGAPTPRERHAIAERLRDRFSPLRLRIRL